MDKRLDNNTMLNKCITNINTQVSIGNENIKNIVVDNTTSGYESLLVDTLDGLSNLIYKGIFGLRDMLLSTSVTVDGVKEYSTTTPSIKKLSTISANVNRVIKEDKLNISKIYNIQAPVTLGLNISLDKMLDEIKGITPYTSEIISTLKNLEEFLNDITSSKIEDISKLLPRDSKISNMEKDNKTILTTLNKFISTGKMSDRKPVKDLIPKINVLPSLIDDSITVGKTYTIESLSDIHELTMNVSSLTESVLKTLNVKGNIDKKTLYKLSNYLKVVAENITMVSFVYYSYYQLLDMLVGVSKIVIHTKPIENNIKDKESSFVSNIESMLKSFITK